MLSDTVHGAMADEGSRDLREEVRVERRPKRERTWRNWMRRNGKATDRFVAPLGPAARPRAYPALSPARPRAARAAAAARQPPPGGRPAARRRGRGRAAGG